MRVGAGSQVFLSLEVQSVEDYSVFLAVAGTLPGQSYLVASTCKVSNLSGGLIPSGPEMFPVSGPAGG